MAADRDFLELAIERARRALQGGNYPVGAVLVTDDDELVAEAENSTASRDGFIFHAEIQLLLANQPYLRSNVGKCRLYCSLEPCLMCLGAAYISRLGALVWAANDYWAGATRSVNSSSEYYSTGRVELVAAPDPELELRSIELVKKFFEMRPNPKVMTSVLGRYL